MPSRCLFRACAVSVLFLGLTGRAGAADLALDYRQVTLKNGMRVITLEDFGCPIVAVQIWFHVGSKDELPERLQVLIEKGVEVGEVRRSANNEFVWFHDPDGNRFELSRPLR